MRPNKKDLARMIYEKESCLASIKWVGGLKNITFPTGLKAKLRWAIVSADGFNPQKFMYLETASHWEFKPMGRA